MLPTLPLSWILVVEEEEGVGKEKEGEGVGGGGLPPPPSWQPPSHGEEG